MKLFLWGFVLFLMGGIRNEALAAAEPDYENTLRKRVGGAVGSVVDEDKDSLSEDIHHKSVINILKESMRRSGIIINSKFLEPRMIPAFLELPLADKYHVVDLVIEKVLPEFSCCSYFFNWIYHPSNRGGDIQTQLLNAIGASFETYYKSEKDIYEWVELISQAEKKDREDIAELISKYNKDDSCLLRLIMPSLIKLSDHEEREYFVQLFLKPRPERIWHPDAILEEVVKLPTKEERDQTLGLAFFISDRHPINAHLAVAELVKVPFEHRIDIFVLGYYINNPNIEILYHEIQEAAAALVKAYPNKKRREIFISLFAPENSEATKLLAARGYRNALIDFLKNRDERPYTRDKIDEMIDTEMKRLNWLRHRGVALWRQAHDWE